MALQVGLPLNGNTNNQGLNSISMVGSPNSGGSGKMGKCATFSPTSTTPTTKIYNTTTSLNYVNEDFSGSVGINPSSTIYGTSYIFTVGRADAGGYGYGMGVSSGSVYCGFGNKNGSVSITHNVGTHISFCRKGNTIKLYKNGVLTSTQTFSGTLPTYSDGNGLGLGCFHYSGSIYAYNGSMNDFRIYNHCLSPKEVKEISKGLVLHYKMDDEYTEPTTNIASNLSPSQIGGGGKMTITKLSTNNYHLKHKTSDSASLSYGSTFVYTLPSTYSNKTISFSARIKNIAYNDIKNSSGLYIGPGNDGQYPTHGSATFYCYELKENQLISWTGVLSNSNRYVLVELGNDANSTSGSIEFDLVDIQIEEKDHVTPYTPTSRSETTVYDCSGFGYNGTTNGTLITSSNTFRYDSSLSFNGSDSAITVGNFSTMVPDGNFTFNCGFYKDSGGSKGYETIFGGPSGFELECKNSSTNSPVIVAYSGGKGTKTYNLNEGNMLTMVRTSSDTKFYLNGELAITGTAGTIPSGNYFIGAGSTSTQQNYKGNVSDVRIYATPLSAEDVKELYNTSAIVCDNGTVMAYSLEE